MAIIVTRAVRCRQVLHFFVQKLARLLLRNEDEPLEHRKFAIGRQEVLTVMPPAQLPWGGKQ